MRLGFSVMMRPEFSWRSSWKCCVMQHWLALGRRQTVTSRPQPQPFQQMQPRGSRRIRSTPQLRPQPRRQCSRVTWCGTIRQVHQQRPRVPRLFQRRTAAAMSAFTVVVAAERLIRCRHWRHWGSQEQRGLLDDEAFVVLSRSE
jgi:hypothetical protein